MDYTFGKQEQRKSYCTSSLKIKLNIKNIVMQVLEDYIKYFFNLGLRKAFFSNLKLTVKG